MKLRRINKKGMDASQLNWVFMLIAGITILLFFFFVVQKQRSISRETLSEKILTNLQGLFVGASVSTGSTNYFDTPQMKFEFICKKDTCNEYGCGESSFSMPEYSSIRKSMAAQPLFSPRSIEGNSMTVITKPWSVPYKTINFVYITSPAIAYVVIYDDADSKAKNLAEDIYNDYLPQEILEQDKKQRRLMVKYLFASSDISGIKNIKQKQIKIISVESSGAILRSIKDFDNNVQQVNSIQITSGLNLEQNGAIKFRVYDKGNLQWVDDGDSTSSYFVGLPAFIGAIYSQDRESYECNMMKAMAAFTQTSSLYEARRQALFDAAVAAGNDACGLTYKQAGDKLKSLVNLKKPNQPIKLDYTTIDTIYKSGMDENSPSLAYYNNRLERQSCPSIY